jgi:hypothetical protein
MVPAVVLIIRVLSGVSAIWVSLSLVRLSLVIGLLDIAPAIAGVNGYRHWQPHACIPWSTAIAAAIAIRAITIFIQ